MPRSHIYKTRYLTAYVSTIMLINMLWYHLALPSYYVLYLHARPLEPTTKYFTVVYYTTGVLDELSFSLLFVMALVLHHFLGGRRWSKRNSAGRESDCSSPGKFRRSNSEESKVPSLHLMSDELIEDKISYFKHRQSTHESFEGLKLLQARQSDRKKVSPDPFAKARETLLVEQIDEQILKKHSTTPNVSREQNLNSTDLTEDRSLQFINNAQIDGKGLSEIHEFDTGNTPSFDEAKKESSDKEDTGSSILDKMHDVVESELYGRSRAVLRRNVDSMICTSEVNHKAPQPKK